MTIKEIYTKAKKNWISLLLIIFLLVIAINPDVKSWLLKQLISTGLLNAEIKKEGEANNTSTVESFFRNSAGEIINTADLKGKVILINFWASWCPPCRAEMPSLIALYQKFKNDDHYVFLFINEDDERDKAINFLKKNNYNISLNSRTANISNEIFSGTLPTTIIIDAKGKIVLKHQGMANYNTDEFIKQLKDL